MIMFECHIDRVGFLCKSCPGVLKTSENTTCVSNSIYSNSLLVVYPCIFTLGLKTYQTMFGNICGECVFLVLDFERPK